MGIVTIASIIAVFLTLLEARGKSDKGMLWGFILITILACIHYDYGNDYMSYYNLYKTVESSSLNDSLSFNYSDPGWIILNYLFRPLGGFFTLVAVLSVVQNVIVYRFIRKNVSKEWWPLSMLIYLFCTSYYLLNFSMMRQGFVVCIFLGLWPWIKEKKIIPTLIILFLCSFIHKSSIILIPFAFWGFLPNSIKSKKFIGLLFLAVLVFFLLNSEKVNALTQYALSLEEFEDYANKYSDAEGNRHFGIGAILALVPTILAFCSIFIEKDDERYKIILLALVGSMFRPFASLLPMIGRLTTYFSIYTLAAYPYCFSIIKNKIFRMGLLCLYFVWLFYDYWLFFNDGAFVEGYSEFHTIFSQF